MLLRCIRPRISLLWAHWWVGPTQQRGHSLPELFKSTPSVHRAAPPGSFVRFECGSLGRNADNSGA